MKTHPRGIITHLALALVLALSAASMTLTFAPAEVVAQDGVIKNDDYGVEITKPKDWETDAGNEKALTVFTHPGTQSQIEVVPTKLMTADVAEVFFNTFYKTLADSNFERENQKDDTIGTMTGKRTTYKFDHSGVTLKVHVFSFVRDTTAWLVVGYWQDSEAKTGEAAFKSTIESLKFSK